MITRIKGNRIVTQEGVIAGYVYFESKKITYVGADGKRAIIPPCPIKVWQGTADKTVDPVMVTEFVESVRRSGSYIEFHLMDGVGHKINDVMRTEIAMWFNRFI